MQGGFLAAMLDDAMGPALFTTLGAEDFAPTIEMKVNFVRPARPGPIIAEGAVVHKTRSLAFLEGKLTTEDGELIATATATARMFPRPGRQAPDVDIRKVRSRSSPARVTASAVASRAVLRRRVLRSSSTTSTTSTVRRPCG